MGPHFFVYKRSEETSIHSNTQYQDPVRQIHLQKTSKIFLKTENYTRQRD